MKEKNGPTMIILKKNKGNNKYLKKKKEEIEGKDGILRRIERNHGVYQESQVEHLLMEGEILHNISSA